VEQRIDIGGDFRAGAAASLGFAASALVFGVIFGAASVTQGIPGLQSIAMSALVFAGTAQFAALELWHDPLPIAAIAVSTAFLNSRLVLLGLALEPIFRPMGLTAKLLTLAFLTDVNALLVLNTKGRGSLAAYFLGSGLVMFAAWLSGTTLGVVLSGLIGSDIISALGFAGVIFLALMMALIAKGQGMWWLPWSTTAAVALLLDAASVSSTVTLFLAVASGAASALIFNGRSHA
jgi:predicted branched-subunit amino acid permease